jgi:phosphoribosyl 1,2-cyclic phosphodiesterase
MELCSIASGSSGNCIYVGTQRTKLLVDAGISKKRMVDGLMGISVNPEELQGIFITHEHLDHVSGLGVFSRKYHIPIYATEETLTALETIKTLGKIDTSLFHPILPDEPIYIEDIRINPFSISHDAKNPVCYTFENEEHKVGIATDLGTYDGYTVSKLEGCEILLLEANHDVNMLQVGGYPYELKRRILGDFGHLSNDNSGRLLCDLIESGLKYIFLGHLSKENNYPDLAYETVRYELQKKGVLPREDIKLWVAKRTEPSQLVSV